MLLNAIRPRTMLLVGALCLGAGWFAGSVNTPQAEDPYAPRVRTGPRPLGSQAPPAPLTRHLRERMDEKPRSPLPGRNPFVFGQRPAFSGSRGRRASEPEPPPPPPPMPEIPVGPVFKLSGIASNKVDGAIVLTAIVNDNGSLAFVKPGDALSNGYKVVSVDEISVVIVDASGVTQTLRLP
jgi:hypothetical protein